ncbi:DNA-cytosine methyltransferase [Alcaligenes faecalis subsp. faecalis NCIB 8687]|nr:DNA-cytosine methyltransferase [Alcaligenes faecalis subsp. faecalis NCIB 8687]
MRSVELFAGGGGLAIGLDRAGFEPTVIIENNRDACQTLERNYLSKKGALVHSGDIRKFDYNSIDGDVVLVSGGPPCQPFSLGGKHKAHSDERDLFPEAARAIRELKPEAFIFENVKGLLRKSFAEYFEYILLQLQYPLVTKDNGEDWLHHLSRLEKYHTSNSSPELCYKVCFRLLNAANYGVPQKRERVFIVGFRSDMDVDWSFPDATHSEDALLWDKWVTGEYWKRHGLGQPEPDLKIKKTIASLHQTFGMFPPTTLPWVTVRDALSDLPDPRERSIPEWNHIFKDGARSYPGHTGSYIDEPSKTLKAGGHGVPGGENMIRFEDDSIRYFTVRESARIQTFPDDYNLQGAWGEAMRQIGNAVPARLAEVVGRSVHQAISSARQ